jgi:hypothetical protein
MFRETAHLYDLIYDAMGKDYAAESAEVRSLLQSRNPMHGRDRYVGTQA